MSIRDSNSLSLASTAPSPKLFWIRVLHSSRKGPMRGYHMEIKEVMT
jgi:hypothetical protein